jgi:sugar phosphate isomerase/epimerase
MTMPKRLSFQLYSARKFPPLKDTLAMLARIGYREVEGFGGVYEKPQAVRRLLDLNGLTMPTGHFGIDLLENDRARVLEIATTLGMRHLYAPYIPPDERPATAAGYRRLGKRLAAIGAWVRSEGFGFGWHNHDFEFVKLESGETPHEILFGAAPMMDWECDVAWIARARSNPIPWIKRYADRITAVHVKDIAPKGQCADEDGWADVGKGTVNWTSVFAALRNSRVLHFIMEHDNPNDVERFAARSFEHVSKI